MSKQTAVEWLYNHLFPTKLDASTEEEWNKIDAIFERVGFLSKDGRFATPSPNWPAVPWPPY